MDSIINTIKSNLKLLTTITISGIIIISVLIFLNKKNENFESLLSEKFYEASILIDKKKKQRRHYHLRKYYRKR